LVSNLKAFVCREARLRHEAVLERKPESSMSRGTAGRERADVAKAGADNRCRRIGLVHVPGAEGGGWEFLRTSARSI